MSRAETPALEHGARPGSFACGQSEGGVDVLHEQLSELADLGPVDLDETGAGLDEAASQHGSSGRRCYGHNGRGSVRVSLPRSRRCGPVRR